MTINFDPNSLNSVFDKNFGAGAYNAGLQNAAKTGQLKAQAGFAKQDFLKRLSDYQAKQKRDQQYLDKYGVTYDQYQAQQAQKKQNSSFDSAMSYWQDASRNKDLHNKGAYQAANDLLNDPKAQEDLKNQGYDIKKLVDAAYNVASDGKFKSEKDYNQYANQLASSTKAERKANLDSFDSQVQQAEASSNQSQQQSQPNDNGMNLYDKLNAGAMRVGDQFLRTVFGNKFADWNNQQDKAAMQYKLQQNPNDTQAKKALLQDATAYSPATTTGQKALNYVGGTAGNILPFLVGDGILSAAGKGVSAVAKGTAQEALAKLATNKIIANPITKKALSGATSGVMGSGLQMGAHNVMSGEQYTPQQVGTNLAESGIAGAVLNPALYGVGKGLSKLLGKGTNAPTVPQEPLGLPAPKNETLGLPAPQLRLNAPQLQLEAPKPSGNALETLLNTGKKPNGLQNPVPESPNSLINMLNDLQNKGVSPKQIDTQTQPTIKDYLNSDPKIKDAINKLFPNGSSVGRPATLNEMVNNLDNLALQSRAQNILNAPKVAPKAPNNVSNSPLFLNPSSLKPDNVLKTVSTSKTLDSMSKDELQTVYKQLQDKKASLTSKKASKKQMQAVEDDLNKVNNFLMNSDLQMFGKGSSAVKKNVNTQANVEPQPKPNPLDAPYQSGDAIPDTTGHIGSKTDKQPLNIKQTANTAYIKSVDNLHRLSQFDNQVSKVLGKDLSASEKTHTLGLNSRGTDMISHQILTSNMVDKNGAVVGNSLKDITMQIPKGKMSEFEDYLVNKHAVTRMKRGEKVFPDEMKMTTGKSQEKVRQYEANNPEFKDLANKIYDYNKQLGQHWLVDTGILSKKDWEGYLKANPNYVPNNRIFSDLEKSGKGNNAKKGFAGQSDPMKKATGSQRKIVSPVESMIEHTAQYVKTAKRNEVMQTLINNIKQDPEAFKGWAEILPTEKGSATYLDSVSNKLKNEGIDAVLEDFNKSFDQKPDLTKGNVVSGIVNGQKVHVKVNDPQLLDALTNLQPQAQHFVMHAIGKLTGIMKTLTTGINPVFSLTRNIWKDIPAAYTNSKTTNNPLKFSKDLVSAIVDVAKNNESYRQFKAVGGGHASPISTDINLLRKAKNSILPRPQGVLNTAKYYGQNALHGIETFNNVIESAPRLAEYKRLAGDSYDSKMKGLYEANDVTVNFNKHGNYAKQVDQVIPYFNAAIQGLDKSGRAFLNPKTAPVAITKAFTAITIPSILDFVVNHNNPDYQKLSNNIKDNNIVIPKGDGTFYKIPVPRELGVVFHSGVTRVLRAMVDKDPHAFDAFATTVINNFSVPTQPTFQPLYNLGTNKSYTGAAIVPQDLQGLSPRYQYDAKTSEPAKFIGNLINMSPKQIDYLTKSYGGVLGQLGIPLTTSNPGASVGQQLGQTLNQQVTADPVYSNDIMTNFYNQKTKLDQAHTDLTKQGIQTSNLNDGLRKAMNAQAKQISDIRKQTKSVQNDNSLTPQERLAKLRQLQDMMNKIASQNLK